MQEGAGQYKTPNPIRDEATQHTPPHTRQKRGKTTQDRKHHEENGDNTKTGTTQRHTPPFNTATAQT
nr:MAG TPA: hypothetical protein [Caudoviricetes sp.]